MQKIEKMMRPEDRHMERDFTSAVAPFPRSTWIHPQVPRDNYDRVCKIIWMRMKETEAEPSRGARETQQGKDNKVQDYKPRNRTEEQQKKTNDLGPHMQYEKDKQQNTPDFIRPCPYLSDPRHVAKPPRTPSAQMEGQMRRREEEAKGQRNLENLEYKQTDSENLQKNVLEGFASGAKPLGRNAALSNALDNPYTQKKNHPPPPSNLLRNTCESEDEVSVRSSSDSNLSDDDNSVTLPGARTCASDSRDDDSARDISDCEEELSSDELSSDSRQDSLSPSTEKDSPPLPTVKAGIQPCPTEPPASGKMHGLWEIPLSFHPNDIPTAALAKGVTAHAQAWVRSKAEAPRANVEINAPPAASAQQDAYDLLADFPALGPPSKPLAMAVVHDGYPKAKAKGKSHSTHLTNLSQKSGASHQSRVENPPRETSPICAGDQKSLDLQTFGAASQSSSSTTSCEEEKANNPAIPTVAGTDGVGGNARSWASAAKAGMKQAAAPQEKARPCTFQQIVTINRAKARITAAQNFANNVPHSYQASHPTRTATCQPLRPRHPIRFARPGPPQPYQHFGGQVYRANCPSGFRWHSPLQQVKGNPSKHSHF